MPIIPFAFQCTIPEYELHDLKDSENGRLVSAFVSKILGFEYYLKLYPNGLNEACRGEVWIGLGVELGDVNNVQVDYIISIESADEFFEDQYTYEKSKTRGGAICTTEEFFNPEKEFIVDGKCTIKIDGVFKFENDDDINFEQQKWDGVELGNELWEDDDDKDITIFVDEKTIKVHKLLLRTRSDVFKAMFNPNTKESVENKVEIPDFTYNVVETAVKMIYNYGFTSSLSLDEMMSVLQFFDKYNIQSLKEKVELLLIDQISAATVCRLTNASITTNSIQLKNKCIEFLEESFASKTYLSDIEILDKDVLVKIVRKSLYEIVEIE